MSENQSKSKVQYFRFKSAIDRYDSYSDESQSEDSSDYYQMNFFDDMDLHRVRNVPKSNQINRSAMMR